MRIVVQKFGGTSVATPELRRHVVRHVARAKQEGLWPVVVVSAMGRAGDPYATDTLLGLLGDVSGDRDLREVDQLLSAGEIIACSLVAQTLTAAGHEAVSLTGAQAGIITDERFGDARILQVKPERVWGLVRSGKVPVVAGFQGSTPSGEVTTLGRGGSDTTAAALGLALGAEVVEIYTDVEGVKTADPRLVPDARTLERVSYREVVELAHLGARVVHPRAVEIAMEGRLPLKIRSTVSDGGGTLVWDGPPPEGIEIRADRPVVGIAHVARLAQVVIRTEGDVNAEGLVLKVFEAVAGAGVSVDMIFVAPGRIQFVIAEDRLERTRQALAPLGLELVAQAGFAKVSAVGAGMHGVPGVMAAVAEALAGEGIPIYQTTDSHANISCLIRTEHLERAVRSLHRRFGLAQGLQVAQAVAASRDGRGGG